MTLTLFLVIFSILTKAQTNESDTGKTDNRAKFNQAINFCPVALALGIYSMNYERLLNEHHGIMVRADYESIPKTYTDANINVGGKAAILNYRYHVKGGLNSCFIGAFSRYRVYNGDGKLDEATFDFKLSEVTVGANVGRRWILRNGLNLTFAVGYGFFMDKQSPADLSEGASESVHQFKNDYDLYNGLFGELSIGYAF